MTPQCDCAAGAIRDGVDCGRDILELALDRVPRRVTALAKAAAIHGEGRHSVSQLVHQGAGGRVVLQRAVDHDERRPIALDPDSERGPSADFTSKRVAVASAVSRWLIALPHHRDAVLTSVGYRMPFAIGRSPHLGP
jgi:hypothetical protein